MTVKHRDVSTETRADLDAEGPLRRWARRRREVAREKEAADEARRRDGRRDESPPPGDAREPTLDASEPAVVEEKVLTDEDMPALESLDENSDYSGFLSSGVSESLRRRALRKLFSSAVFNIPDGLDDYDDDFTTFEALGDIVTSDMKHQAEAEAERAKTGSRGLRSGARRSESFEAEEGPRNRGTTATRPCERTTRRSARKPVPTVRRSPPVAAALPDCAAPDAVAEEDATGGWGTGPGCRRAPVAIQWIPSPMPRAPADTGTPDDVEATGRARGEAVAGRGAAASSGRPEDGSHAPDGDGEPRDRTTRAIPESMREMDSGSDMPDGGLPATTVDGAARARALARGAPQPSIRPGS